MESQKEPLQYCGSLFFDTCPNCAHRNPFDGANLQGNKHGSLCFAWNLFPGAWGGPLFRPVIHEEQLRAVPEARPSHGLVVASGEGDSFAPFGKADGRPATISPKKKCTLPKVVIKACEHRPL